MIDHICWLNNSWRKHCYLFREKFHSRKLTQDFSANPTKNLCNFGENTFNKFTIVITLWINRFFMIYVFGYKRRFFLIKSFFNLSKHINSYVHTLLGIILEMGQFKMLISFNNNNTTIKLECILVNFTLYPKVIYFKPFASASYCIITRLLRKNKDTSLFSFFENWHEILVRIKDLLYFFSKSFTNLFICPFCIFLFTTMVILCLIGT